MLEVRVLGTFAIQLDGKPVVLSSRIAQSLFAYLILSASIRHRREKLAGMFWPDATDAKARTYLRHELWLIRKALSSKSTADYFLVDDITIGFNARAEYWLDVAVLKESGEASSSDELINTLALFQGEFLPGFYEEWVSIEREHLHTVYEQRMAHLLELLGGEKRWTEMIEWAERWIFLGRGPETAYRALMLAYDGLGDRPRVTATYQRCVQMLYELGLEPSEETRSLAFSRTHKSNIPIPLTSFIGREREVKEVADLLLKSRLVTLTGSGGVGKTRLAIQAVAEVLDRFPDGVWFLDLAPFSDAALVPNILASLFGLRESGEFPIANLLTNFLQTRTALVILDNCEHLIEACAQLAHSLLTSCETLSILATSREVLWTLGEIPYRVPSLEFPQLETGFANDNLPNIESVRLFIERASVVSPGFALRPQNAFAIAQVCQRLDGIPLAIELAASRLTVLTAEQLAERLDDAFRLLTSGARTSLPRHQTLRATIDWSYQLLSERERALLRCLSVFVGSFDLGAIEAVCGLQEMDHVVYVEVLASLVNKSMLLAERQQKLGLRYHLLETVRQYARDKLDDSGERPRLDDRHAVYYLAVAEQYEAILYDNDMQAADRLMRTDAELANIRMALAWALDGPTPQKGISAAQSLKGYWIMRGLLGEGRAWLEKALSREASSHPSPSHAGVLLHLGDIIHHSASNEEKAYEYIAQARAMYEDLGDRLGYARATQKLPGTDAKPVSVKLRAENYAEIAAIFKELGAEGDLAYALWGWGWLRADCHDFEGARSLLEEAERLYRKLGSWQVGAVQLTLAWTYWRLAQPERARDLFQQGFSTMRVVDDQWGLLIFLAYQGEMEMELASDSAGLYRAEAILLEELEIARKFGSKSTFFAYITALLGKVAQKQCRYSLAIERFRQALLTVQELGPRSWDNAPEIIGRCLFGLAEVAVSVEQAVFSSRLLAALEMLQASWDYLWIWIMPGDFERVTAAARAQLGEAAFQSAWNAGLAMTLDEAVVYALKRFP